MPCHDFGIPANVELIRGTSVPGHAEKPAIDVLLGARSLDDIESKIETLGEIGYEHIKKKREPPMRRHFVKFTRTSRRTHLHAVERDSRIWQEQLAFRVRCTRMRRCTSATKP